MPVSQRQRLPGQGLPPHRSGIGLHPLPTYVASGQRLSRDMQDPNVLAAKTIRGSPWSYPGNLAVIIATISEL